MTGHGITLCHDALTVELDRRGAVITGLWWWGADGTRQPLMRDGSWHDGDPSGASCFPMLPFGNRVTGNRFTVGEQEYGLAPNQPWDPHYLHGDGWLSLWGMKWVGDATARFTLRHAAQPGQPYDYDATIDYTVTAAPALAVSMTLRNTAAAAMPFGLGLHPYFPLTPDTLLRAPAARYYTEGAGFMPGPAAPLPADLDFTRAAPLPRRWLNNGFAGWNGRARIAWPENKLALVIDADEAFSHYVLFMPDAAFEPGFEGDYFCLEPMTHQADGHHAADLGGLALLAPGEAMTARIVFTPEETAA
jgi:aldose 1-epimerase